MNARNDSAPARWIGTRRRARHARPTFDTPETGMKRFQGMVAAYR